MEGGYGQKGENRKNPQKIYAGVEYDRENYPRPTAVGRYCEWVHKSVDQSLNSESFESFFDTLRLECQPGEPGKLVWFVENDTPDTVYYQVNCNDIFKSFFYTFTKSQLHFPLNMVQSFKIGPIFFFKFKILNTLKESTSVNVRICQLINKT